MNRFLSSVMTMPLRSPDEPAAAAVVEPVIPAAETPAAVVPAADPGSILFPNDVANVDPDPLAGDPPAADPNAPAEWKEYENDASKTDEENAAAKAEHDKTKPAGADPLDVVPADGKYELTMPEGITVDQELLDALAPDFLAKKMTPREAQALTDKFVKVQTDRAEAKNKAWAETVAGWVTEAKADADMGGAKWDATAKTARTAIDTLGTPELKEYLQATGGGNHPELIRIFAKVGAMITEDNPANGGVGGSGKPADAAHVLFPNDVPKG